MKFRDFLAKNECENQLIDLNEAISFKDYKINVSATGERTNAGEATYIVNWLDVYTKDGNRLIYMGGAKGRGIEFYDEFRDATTNAGIVKLHNSGFAYYDELIKEYGNGGVNYNNVSKVTPSKNAEKELNKIVKTFIEKAIKEKYKNIEGSIFMDNNQQKKKAEFSKIISNLGLYIETETRSVIEYSGKLLYTTELDNIKRELNNGTYYIIK